MATMKIVLILLIPLVFAKTKWVPAGKQNDLPPNLQSYLRFENGRFFIKNGSKIPILFVNGQFAFKFTKEKCRAGIRWFYTDVTAELESVVVSERDFKNDTGESELVVKSDGRSLLDNGFKWKIKKREAFKINENGISLVEFEVADSNCDVVLSQGKVMVEKVEPDEPVADASTTVIIIVGCGIAVVALATIGGFLGYWFGCRKKKKVKTEEEKIEKPPAIVAKKESKEKPKPKPKSKSKKVKEKEKEKLSKEKKSDDDEISDRTLTKNFKKKKARFKKAAKKYRFDMVELGTVLNFVKIMGEVEVCSTRVVKDQSLKMIDIGGTYDFHDARIMDPLEVRLLSEMSQQTSSIVEQMRFHARRIFKEEFGYDK
uniref:Uncharacterized protein n=1 Tax=Panagrolaimus sp. JU765 TaxID=591449 RepID=A0AC34PV20_9BILA